MKRLLVLLAVITGFGLLIPGAGSAATPPVWDSGPPDPSIADGSARAAFNEARTRWLDAKVRNYRMKVRISCFCLDTAPLAVKVRNGKVMWKRNRAWRERFRQWRSWDRARTVPQLFRVVHQLIRARVPTLEVSYDPTLGFVKSVWADQMLNVADDEFGYRVAGFRRP